MQLMSRLCLTSWEVACPGVQRVGAKQWHKIHCPTCKRSSAPDTARLHLVPVLYRGRTDAEEDWHRVGRPVTLCWRLERAAHGLMPTESPVVRYEAHSQVRPDLTYMSESQASAGFLDNN